MASRLDGLRVCFDVLGAQDLAWDRGIPRYITEHAAALGRVSAGLDLVYRAEPSRPLMPPAQQLVASGRLRRTRHSPWSEGDVQPHLLHISSPFELSVPQDALWPSWSRNRNWTTVATIWDLVPLLFPDLYLANDPALADQYRQRVRMLASVDHLVAISQHTAEDAERHLGVPAKRITVIDAGVDHARFAPSGGPDPLETVRTALPGVRDRFLFYVGGDDPRKNMAGLLRAFARSQSRRDGVQLVITCSLRPDRVAELMKVATDAGADEADVVLTGHLPDQALIALYQACTLFVFPSLYEGSGLPMLEAMAAGAPVIAASTSTGPEIVGRDDPDAIFDPYDDRDITRTIDATIGTPGRLDELRHRSAERSSGFTWEHVAAQTLVAYERAIDHSRIHRRAGSPTRRPLGTRQRRLAVVTPLPPERTGIADYASRLIPALRERSELPIDVVISDDAPAPDASEGVMRETAFRARVALGARYEGALFQLGNSGFHAHMLDLLPWTSDQGVRVGAMMHEANLAGISVDGVRDGLFTTRELAARVYADYPFLRAKPDWEMQDFLIAQGSTHGVYLTARLQASSDAIVTHSAVARDLLLADRGDGAGPEITVVPHAAPPPRQVDEERDRDLIVSTGAVAAIKDVEALLRAFVVAHDARPTLRLVLAGPHGRAEEIDAFREIIAEHDLRSAVTMTGYLDEDERWALLDRAGVVVQLRQRSHGEASGAVIDALTAGAPTIVSDVGWMADLPRDVVERVAPSPDPADLARLLLALTGDARRAAALGAAAHDYVRTVAFDRVARDVLRAWVSDLGTT